MCFPICIITSEIHGAHGLFSKHAFLNHALSGLLQFLNILESLLHLECHLGRNQTRPWISAKYSSEQQHICFRRMVIVVLPSSRHDNPVLAPFPLLHGAALRECLQHGTGNSDSSVLIDIVRIFVWVVNVFIDQGQGHVCHPQQVHLWLLCLRSESRIWRSRTFGLEL